MLKKLIIMCMICAPIANASDTFEKRVRETKRAKYPGHEPSRAQVIALAQSLSADITLVRRELSAQRANSHSKLVSCYAQNEIPSDITKLETFAILIQHAVSIRKIDKKRKKMCIIHNHWGNAANHKFTEDDCLGLSAYTIMSVAEPKGRRQYN